MLDQIKIEPGTVLFHEGDPGDRAYVIEKGKVEVTAHRGERKVLLSALSALLWSFVITPDWVKRTAIAYAERLLGSVEQLD